MIACNFQPYLLIVEVLLCFYCVVCNGIESYFVLESSSVDIVNHRNATIVTLDVGYVTCNIACIQSQTCVSFFFNQRDQRCHLQYVHVVREDISGEATSNIQYWRPNHANCPKQFYFVPRFASCYWFSKRTETLATATSICEGYRAHIVYLETPDELAYIQRQIVSTPELLRKSNYRAGGLKDGQTWRWGVGGEPVNMSLFSKEPSAAFTKLKRSSDGYMLIGAGDGDIAFICEVDIM